jgi:hypothetical protein
LSGKHCDSAVDREQPPVGLLEPGLLPLRRDFPHTPPPAGEIDVVDNVQRNELEVPGQPPTVLVTELSPLQRTILKLLDHSREDYGR